MNRTRHIFRSAFTAGVVAGLLLSTLVEGAGATGGISGRVTGPDGEALAGVEVQAFGPTLCAW